MAKAKFVVDPDFENNLYRASNKSRSSLSPLFDLVRNVTDRIASIAKTELEKLAEEAESQVEPAKKLISGDNPNQGKKDFRRAKARAFALKSGANSTFPVMDYDGEGILGRVVINRRGSASLEYGGIDPVAELGKGTGEYVSHPAYAILRNAARRA